MGNWGISENATPKEKLKSQMADFLNGLNSVGEINISTYDEIFDFSMDLLEKMYDLGKSEQVDCSCKENEEDTCEHLLNDEIKLLFNNLKIPKEKVDLEIKRECKFIKYYGFPFFLRKEERHRKVEAITINEYPKGKHLIAHYPYRVQADSVNYIELSPQIVEEFLKQGFTWFHESEMDTMW